MSNVYVFDHPLIQHKTAMIRKEDTSVKDFRELVREISMLMGYEATRKLPLEEVEITTPICDTKVNMLKGEDIAIVPILRAGLGMVDGMLALVPNAKVGHVEMCIRDRREPGAPRSLGTSAASAITRKHRKYQHEIHQTIFDHLSDLSCWRDLEIHITAADPGQHLWNGHLVRRSYERTDQAGCSSRNWKISYRNHATHVHTDVYKRQAKVFPTGKRRCFWNVRMKASIRKFSDWRRKSRKNFMATGSCCSRRCIFQTTASMAVNTARIMDRTSISAERS